MLNEMPDNSLQFSTEIRSVRLDGELPEVEQSYLTVNGTSRAFRWLSTLLSELANSAERDDNPSGCHGVIVSPKDLPQISIIGWSSLSLECRRE